MKTLKWISLVMLVLGLCSNQVQAQLEPGVHINIAGYFYPPPSPPDPNKDADIGHVGDQIFYKVTVFTTEFNYPIINGDPNIIMPDGTFIEFEPLGDLALGTDDSKVSFTYNYPGGI